MPGLDSYVKLLLHCDGADASTTFTDSSASARTVSPAGNMQIDTADSKFGGASGLGDGVGDYLTCASSSDFNIATGPWTWDFQFKWASGTNVTALLARYNSGSPYNGWVLSFNKNTQKFIFYSNAATTRITQSGTTSSGSWHHFALISDGTTVTMAVDGASQGTWVGNPQDVAQTLYICAEVNQTNPSFGGWIDEVRFSQGIARWSSFPFTPPTEEYNDSAATVGGNMSCNKGYWGT